MGTLVVLAGLGAGMASCGGKTMENKCRNFVHVGWTEDLFRGLCHSNIEGVLSDRQCDQLYREFRAACKEVFGVKSLIVVGDDDVVEPPFEDLDVVDDSTQLGKEGDDNYDVEIPDVLGDPAPLTVRPSVPLDAMDSEG